jgi:hypothetical protein
MKYRIGKIMAAAIFAAALSAQANAKTHSKSIVVESPSDLPEMARRNSEAMYLHERGVGQAVLYLEQDQGRTLAILDVTKPGAIRALAQVSIAAPSPYDFVGTFSDSAVLIHYREHSGFAVLDLKKYKEPVLAELPQLEHPAQPEALGDDALLLASTAHSGVRVEDSQYEVIDTSNPSKATVLATVAGVRQRLERTETGTLFLLTNTGLTVIRRPNVEYQYKIASAYANRG